MFNETELKEKLQNTYPDSIDLAEVHTIVEEVISSANMMLKEMYLPKFIENFTFDKRLDLFKHIIQFSKETNLQIKFLNRMFEKSLIESLSTYHFEVLELTDELC